MGVINPYSITPESHNKFTKIKETITNLEIVQQILLVSTFGNAIGEQYTDKGWN